MCVVVRKRNIQILRMYGEWYIIYYVVNISPSLVLDAKATLSSTHWSFDQHAVYTGCQQTAGAVRETCPRKQNPVSERFLHPKQQSAQYAGDDPKCSQKPYSRLG